MTLRVPQHLLRDLTRLSAHWQAQGAVVHGTPSPPRWLPPDYRLHTTLKFTYQQRECVVLLDQYGTVTLKAWIDDDGQINLKTVARPGSLGLPPGFHDPEPRALPTNALNHEDDWHDRREQAYAAPLLAEQRQLALRDVRRQKVMLQRRLDLLTAVEEGHQCALEAAESADIFELLEHAAGSRPEASPPGQAD